MSKERFDHLEKLKVEAATTLNLPIDSDNVALLAALKLQHQSMLESLVSNRAVDAAELLSVTEAIAKSQEAEKRADRTAERTLPYCQMMSAGFFQDSGNEI
jgi:hypothetical protein